MDDIRMSKRPKGAENDEPVPIKKVYVPMIRYGDREFDEGFVGWGFQSLEEQERDARSVLWLTSRVKMKMLDLGCGLGSYHHVWLEAGHTVVGTDLSETFIMMASNTNPGASYRVENFYDLDETEAYDVVTMIDTPLEDEDLARNVHRALRTGGIFVFQLQSPSYKHLRGPVLENRRDWVDNEDGTFLLTRHEYNEEIDRWEYEEWHLDMKKREVVVEHNFSHNLGFSRIVDILQSVGFTTVSFFDPDGRPNGTSRVEPSKYFCVAYKGVDG